jgi:hypothetical protein
MDTKETLGKVKNMVEKIPAQTRAKVSLLDRAIPFANQIVCGAAVLLVVVVLAIGWSGCSAQSSKNNGANNAQNNEANNSMDLSGINGTIERFYELAIKGDGVRLEKLSTEQGKQIGLFQGMSLADGISRGQIKNFKVTVLENKIIDDTTIKLLVDITVDQQVITLQKVNGNFVVDNVEGKGAW